MSLKIKNLIADIEKIFRKDGFKIFRIDQDLSIMQIGSWKGIDMNEATYLMLTAFNSLDYKIDIKFHNRYAGAITVDEEEVKTVIKISIDKKKRFRRCRIIITFIQSGKEGKLLS